jgi:arginine decarboxylase
VKPDTTASAPASLATGGSKTAAWTAADAAELYRVDVWSDGFFGIDPAGHAIATPREDADIRIDLARLAEDLRNRGIQFPALVRFQDVLSARVRRINQCFREAIAACGYQGGYQGVYPIKVNQLHEVVEEVLDAGAEFRLGLECGSKAELMAALPHLVDDDLLLICNGVKDRSMLSLIHMGQRLGKQALPIVEKDNELREWLQLTRDSTAAPFGVRIRLTVAGSGRWQASSGDHSKFGLSIAELTDLLKELEAHERTTDFVLLHFHLGSQIADVSVLRRAVKEAAQIYAQLRQRGIDIRFLDVGGGLGVRYDVASAEDESGISYGIREYANTVVQTVAEVCDNQSVPHPILVSESGRAITAHHSMLIVEVLGAYAKPRLAASLEAPGDSPAEVQTLSRLLRRIRSDGEPVRSDQSRLLEAYHQARDVRREAELLLQSGHMPIEALGQVERLYWSILHAVADGFDALALDPSPPERDEVEAQLVENYLCDFSVFQSMLDHWAIGQNFPIMPLQRLDEEPTRRTRLVDLTCDSDGKVGQYVTADAKNDFLRLHPLRTDERYYLGLFLMGAYQDIMGDSHNLFGRVPEVHIYADIEEKGGYWVEKVIPGTRVQEMLEQVQYFASDLQRRMNSLVRQKIDQGAIRPSAGMEIMDHYRDIFNRSTYCETE